jgi:Tfp pilus assembly protein PilO
MYVKLENENSFVKNIENLALINRDIAGLKEYRNKKETTTKMMHISDEINNMKSEIKSLLQQLVNNSQSGK